MLKAVQTKILMVQNVGGGNVHEVNATFRVFSEYAGKHVAEVATVVVGFNENGTPSQPKVTFACGHEMTVADVLEVIVIANRIANDPYVTLYVQV